MSLLVVHIGLMMFIGLVVHIDSCRFDSFVDSFVGSFVDNV